MFNMSG